MNKHKVFRIAATEQEVEGWQFDSFLHSESGFYKSNGLKFHVGDVVLSPVYSLDKHRWQNFDCFQLDGDGFNLALDCSEPREPIPTGDYYIKSLAEIEADLFAAYLEIKRLKRKRWWQVWRWFRWEYWNGREYRWRGKSK